MWCCIHLLYLKGDGHDGRLVRDGGSGGGGGGADGRLPGGDGGHRQGWRWRGGILICILCNEKQVTREEWVKNAMGSEFVASLLANNPTNPDKEEAP